MSHSKKWVFVKAMDDKGVPILAENGKAVLIPSYSLLQDRFYEHMKEAGYTDFERSVRGSTVSHLSVLDYKIQQDSETLARIEKQVETQQKELASISEQLIVEQQTSRTFHELDDLGKKKLFGKVELAENDYKEVIALARECLLSRKKIADLSRQLSDAASRLFSLQSSWDQLYEQTRDFRQAMMLAPQRVKELFADIFTKARQGREERQLVQKARTHGEQVR